MTLDEIKNLLDAKFVTGEDKRDMEIDIVCSSDLLSDVLAFTKSGALLLTGLTHPQVIRTTEIAEIKAVCFVRGKYPPEETIELAKEKDVPLLCTSLLMYEASGRLYCCDLSGCSQEKR